MKRSILLIVAFVITVAPQFTLAHCEIPCGIYNDELRFEILSEHITTIAKSIDQINAMSSDKSTNYNQVVRWVTNKETHATEYQHVVEQYFMTQRIKPADSGDAEAYETYVKQITLAHQMVVTAMKTKQSLDTANVDKLRELLQQFYSAYFGPDHEKHTH